VTLAPNSRIAIIKHGEISDSETFIRDHVRYIPANSVWAATIKPSGVDEGLVNFLKAHRPRVVLAEFGPSAARALPAIRSLGIALVPYFHGYDVYRRETLKRYREEYIHLFGYARVMLCASSEIAETLVTLGADRSSLRVIPCGVPLDQTDASDEVRPGCMLFVGRFVEKKGPHEAVLIFRKIVAKRPNATLIMIGDGHLRQSCELLTKKLGVENAVRFLGTVSREAVFFHMKHAKVLINHSITAPDGDREGSPVCLMEAASRALPCVATDSGGIRDVVIDGATGFLVPERDYDEAASKAIELLDNPQIWRAVSARARLHALNNFSLANHIGQVMVACLDALDG
jgi:colanic acid/amylovoran biosynthesis glycosyltransferase